jgi:glyoxylase-like metal-dependent hydrolase (beta-lactamase superfamily II)
MFIRASTEVYPRCHQITIGGTCRFAIVSEDRSITLVDPGSSAHIPALEERLSSAGLALSQVSRILITHLHADRVGAIPLLRQALPRLAVCGNAAMTAKLRDAAFVESVWRDDCELREIFTASGTPLSLKDFRDGLSITKSLADGETLAIDEDITVRAISTPGHTDHSQSFLVLPFSFLIGDETLGYYQGRRLATPGGDLSLESAVTSIKRFKDIQLTGIGFSYGGCITGGLARKHLDAVLLNTSDLITETRAALERGVAVEEVLAQVRESLFVPLVEDPCLVRSLGRSCDEIWKQLAGRLPHRAAGAAPTS